MQSRDMTRLIAFLSLASACASLGLTPATSTRNQQLNVDTFSTSVSPHEVSDLFFLDSLRGWMTVTDHRTGATYVVRTRDGGQSWEKFDALPGMHQLYFIDAERGWGLHWYREPTWPGTRVKLVATKDGGEHWTPLSAEIVFKSIRPMGEFITSMAFSSESEGWLVGEVMFETNDGGRTFTRVERAHNCSGVYASTKTGIIVYGLGFVLRSVDHGKTWASPIDIEKLGINRSAFITSSARFLSDGRRGWLAGQAGYGAILITHDYGKSWRTEFEDKGGTIFEDLWLTDSKRRCAVGNSTQLFCTDSDGSTWSSTNVLPSPSVGQSPIFKSIVLLDSGRGWIVRYEAICTEQPTAVRPGTNSIH